MLDFMVKVSFLIDFFFPSKIQLNIILGMYFSSSLFYSSKYSKDSPDGKPFIICMITPGNVYPGFLSFSIFYYSFHFFSFLSSIRKKNSKNSNRESIY